MTSHAPSALLLPLWAKTDEIFNLRGFIVQSRRRRRRLTTSSLPG